MNVSKRALLPAFGLKARLEEKDFEQIFHQLYPRIVEVASRFTESQDEAEEIASDAFWKLWNSPPRNQDNLPGWLYRVATHLGYNALRAKRRRADYEVAAGRLILAESGVVDPQRAAEQRDERCRVQAILLQMPRRDVQILLLRHSGLSYSEIAGAMKINPTSVGTLLARAERKFDHMYREGEQDAS
jgi:RNA polymerase sigma factor (sigma-70 family)